MFDLFQSSKKEKILFNFYMFFVGLGYKKIIIRKMTNYCQNTSTNIFSSKSTNAFIHELYSLNLMWSHIYCNELINIYRIKSFIITFIIQHNHIRSDFIPFRLRCNFLRSIMEWLAYLLEFLLSKKEKFFFLGFRLWIRLTNFIFKYDKLKKNINKMR